MDMNLLLEMHNLYDVFHLKRYELEYYEEKLINRKMQLDSLNENENETTLEELKNSKEGTIFLEEIGRLVVKIVNIKAAVKELNDIYQEFFREHCSDQEFEDIFQRAIEQLPADKISTASKIKYENIRRNQNNS